MIIVTSLYYYDIRFIYKLRKDLKFTTNILDHRQNKVIEWYKKYARCEKQRHSQWYNGWISLPYMNINITNGVTLRYWVSLYLLSYDSVYLLILSPSQ